MQKIQSKRYEHTRRTDGSRNLAHMVGVPVVGIAREGVGQNKGRFQLFDDGLHVMGER